MKTSSWNPYDCQICGGSLLHPQEIKQRYHDHCFRDWESRNYVGGK